MSAPVSDRTRTQIRGAAARGATRTRSTTIPAQRSGPAATPRVAEALSPTPRVGRKQQTRAGRSDRARRTSVGRPVRAATAARRPQFVLLVMVLLAVGLVATLWLSTAAAAGSYHLQAARATALALSQQSERLHREVADLESAPELARRAEALGMVPVQDSARLVVAPDGSVTVVGQPRAATAPPPPPAPAPPASPATPAPPAGQGAPAAPGGGNPASADDTAPSGSPQDLAAPRTDPTDGTAAAAAQAHAAGANSPSGAAAAADAADDSTGAGTGTQAGAADAGDQGDSVAPGTTSGATTQGAGGADGTGND